VSCRPQVEVHFLASGWCGQQEEQGCQRSHHQASRDGFFEHLSWNKVPQG